MRVQTTDGKWYDMAVTLTPVAPAIPANATVISAIEGSTLWQNTHDAATPGTSTGTSGLAGSLGRNFNFAYTQKAGQRYSVHVGVDPLATHFVYAVDVYFDDPSQIQNLELDVNQVLADGRTCILGVQAASGSGTWEYTLMNAPTHWQKSNIATNPTKWTAKTWHTIRIFSHQADGVVTYDGIEFDGVYTPFTGAAGSSAVAIGWNVGTLLLNFQIEGTQAAGTVNVYARNMSLTRW